jgi:hypothetical protein
VCRCAPTCEISAVSELLCSLLDAANRLCILDTVRQTADLARRVRDRAIESREARRKLKVSGKPYWRAIGRGLHVGYRKGKTGGVWVIHRYLGNQTYQLETIAEADDVLDANGNEILDFWQAQEVARSARQSSKRTVRDAVNAYVQRMEGRASWNDTKKRIEAFVVPVFGDKPVAKLEADEIRRWHRDLPKTPARCRTRGLSRHTALTTLAIQRQSGNGRSRQITV